MESHIRLPSPLKDATVKSWTLWKEEFYVFMSLTGYASRDLDFQANMFKNHIGPVGIELISKLSFIHPGDKNNLHILMRKIDNYFNPQETEIQKRYKFFSRTKKVNETMECYVTALEQEAKGCNFGVLAESFIRDVIILQTSDEELRKKYLQMEHLTKKEILQIYTNHMQQKSSQNNQKGKNKKTFQEKELNKCWRCATNHLTKCCPAWNYKCTICSTMHHFEKCCQNKTNTQPGSSYTQDRNNLNRVNRNQKSVNL